MLTPIEYKLVRDAKGTIKGVELWQDGQHVTISLESFGLHESGYRWLDVQRQVEALQEVARTLTEKDLSNNYKLAEEL